MYFGVSAGNTKQLDNDQNSKVASVLVSCERRHMHDDKTVEYWCNVHTEQYMYNYTYITH